MLFHILITTDSRIFLCDFHREQAWLRWISSSNNNMRENKEECLYYLRKIAFSETFREYSVNVSSLNNSDVWNDGKSKGFRNWIGNKWLPKYEVFWIFVKNYVLLLPYFTSKVVWQNFKTDHYCFLFGKSFFQVFLVFQSINFLVRVIDVFNTEQWEKEVDFDFQQPLNPTYYQKRFQKPCIWTLKLLTLVSIISICWCKTLFLNFKCIVRDILPKYLTNNTE